MKKIFLFISLLYIAFSFISCEKDQDKIIVNENIAPIVLDPLTANAFVLNLDNKADTFQVFKWNMPDYGFDAEITYKIQIDKKGNNFASAMDIASASSILKASTLIGDINKNLLTLGLEPGTADTIEIRVKATINENVDPVYSNAIEVIVTTYATSFPPIYLIGDDTGGWNLVKAAVVESSAPSVYSTIIHLTNSKTFRFFTEPSWTATQYNYLYFSTVNSSLINADDNDKNFRLTGATGFYRITVNLKTKNVDLEAVPEPVLFMTGAALGGWDWTDNYKKLSWQSDGVFMDTVKFINGETFRFFKQIGWGEGYNYPAFIADSVSTLFANANDGDKNFRFVGTTGIYIITVNLKTLTVKMEVGPASEPDPTLFIIGSLNSWSTDNAIQMTWVSGQIFKVSQTLTSGDKFRFFATASWSLPQYNFADLNGGTMPTEFSNDGSGDQNFVFTGPTGTYTITVDLTTKTITLDPPAIYIVGSINGWDLNTAIKMTWQGGSIYKATTNITNNDIFRFFETPSWSATTYNFSYFTTMDASFISDGGGDQNLKFTGITGTYTLTIDLANKSVVKE